MNNRHSETGELVEQRGRHSTRTIIVDEVTQQFI